MSGRAPQGSPLRPRPPRRGPRPGGVSGVPRGGAAPPVPPGKLQLLERFFTPPGPPPETPSSSSSPSPSPASCSSSSSSSSSGGLPSPRPGDPPRGFGDPPGGRGSRLRRGLSRSHEGLLSPGGDPSPPTATLGGEGEPPPAQPPRRGRGQRRGPGEPLGGEGAARGLNPGEDPRPPAAPPPPRRRDPRSRPPYAGDSAGVPRGSLRRGQSRSQEEGLGAQRPAGTPRRWRSLEGLGARRGSRGGSRGGPRFSRFLDELTRNVLSPAELRALGWPPRDPHPPRDPPRDHPRDPPGRGAPRTPPASPRDRRPRSGESPGLEEEEEEEETGQEPGSPGGTGGAQGPPPARAELEALRERMDRLQDEYAHSQRLNLQLEERLRGLAQAMALERAALSRHVAEVLQRVLGSPPGPGNPPRETVVTWGGAEDEDEEGGEGPLLPPPAFRDPPGGAGP